MAIQPVPPDHARNRRDDEHSDFEALKAAGKVRNKKGDIIGIDHPHTSFSAMDRDRLFQAYCAFVKSAPSNKAITEWITHQASKIVSKKDGRTMSYARAEKLIGQGCGGWVETNTMWWRGVSLP